MNENFIMITKNWLIDKDDVSNTNLLYRYGEVGFAFYIYCRLFEQAYDGSSRVIIGEFLDLFGFTNSRTRKNKKQELLATIRLMEDDGLIVFYKSFSLNEIISFDESVKDTTTLFCKVDKFLEYPHFVKLSKLEIGTILESDNNNKISLLIHFIAVMCFENHSEDSCKDICFPSIEALAIRAQTSVNTAMRHNKSLFELKVLYYDNAGTKYIEGAPQSFSNTYSRWANKGLVDSFVVKTIAESKDRLANTTKAKQERTNQSRSLIATVNHLNRKEKEVGLTASEIIKKDTMQEQYNELRAIIKKDQDKGYEHFDKNKR